MINLKNKKTIHRKKTTKAWKKIKSKTVHKNPWWNLFEDDVVKPSGGKGKYFLVNIPDAVVVIAENEKEEIYLVGQTRYAIGNIYSWEFVGGGSDGQTSLQAAKKELQEEAGLLAKTWIKLGYSYPDNSISTQKTVFYLARDLKKIKATPEETEDIKVKKVSLERIIEMIESDKIVHNNTIVAFYKYLIYKKRNKNIIETYKKLFSIKK